MTDSILCSHCGVPLAPSLGVEHHEAFCPECGEPFNPMDGSATELSLEASSAESTSQHHSHAPLVTSEEKYWESESLEQPTGIFKNLVNLTPSTESGTDEPKHHLSAQTTSLPDAELNAQHQEITDPQLPSETSENFLSDELDAAFSDIQHNNDDASQEVLSLPEDDAAQAGVTSVAVATGQDLSEQTHADGLNPFQAFELEFQRSMSAVMSHESSEPSEGDQSLGQQPAQSASTDPFAAFDRAFEAAVSNTPPPLRLQTTPSTDPSDELAPPPHHQAPESILNSSTGDAPLVDEHHFPHGTDRPHPDTQTFIQNKEHENNAALHTGLLLPRLADFGRWVPTNTGAPPSDVRSALTGDHDEKTLVTTQELDSKEDDESFELEEIPPTFSGFQMKGIIAAAGVSFVLGCLVGLIGGPHTGPSEDTAEGKAALSFATGNELFAEEKADAALAEYRNAINHGFSDPIIFRAKGAALAKQRRFEEAAKAYKEYLQRSPNAPDKVEIEASLSKFYAKDDADD